MIFGIFQSLEFENFLKEKSSNSYAWFKQVAKNIERCSKNFTFIYCLLPNLTQPCFG
jgi:hypothetical protein